MRHTILCCVPSVDSSAQIWPYARDKVNTLHMATTGKWTETFRHHLCLLSAGFARVKNKAFHLMGQQNYSHVGWSKWDKQAHPRCIARESNATHRLLVFGEWHWSSGVRPRPETSMDNNDDRWYVSWGNLVNTHDCDYVTKFPHGSTCVVLRALNKHSGMTQRPGKCSFSHINFQWTNVTAPTREMHTGFLWENLNQRDHLEDASSRREKKK